MKENNSKEATLLQQLIAEELKRIKVIYTLQPSDLGSAVKSGKENIYNKVAYAS